MTRYYVEIHETRRSVTTIEARNQEEAERLAAECVSAGELPCETLDREVIALRLPNKDAA